MLTPDALMGTALTAARQAAGVIRTSPPGNLTPKGPRDVTSEVDFAVETQLRDYLRSQTPSIGFLGEEGGVSGPDDLVWILDPIDGTVNFTRGLPLCGVSLALARGQWPILGVVSFPFLNMQYTAIESRGAFRNSTRLRVSKTNHMDYAVVAFGDFAVGLQAHTKNTFRLEVICASSGSANRTRMLGSAALDLCWLADGHLDASITLSNKPWDTAAGTLIAREAGASVVDLDGSPHSLASRVTLAATPGLIGDIIELVRDASHRAGEPSTRTTG